MRATMMRSSGLKVLSQVLVVKLVEALHLQLLLCFPF